MGEQREATAAPSPPASRRVGFYRAGRCRVRARTGSGMRAQRRYLNAVWSGTRRLVPQRRPRLIEAVLLAATILLVVIAIDLWL